MADGFTPQDPLQAPIEPLSADPPAGGLGASSGGRIVVIIVAVVLLLAVLGAAAFFLLPSLLGDDDGGQVAVTPSTSAGTGTGSSQATSGAPTPEAASEEPDIVPLGDVFTFRDIFEVLLPAPPEEGATDGTTPTASDGDTSTPDVSENTLFLEDIVILDGIPYAYLLWNGEEFVLTEGESIPGTPWQVLTINADSVVMLFGDVPVTLTIGQGVSK